jgi:hypothetical protein
MVLLRSQTLHSTYMYVHVSCLRNVENTMTPFFLKYRAITTYISCVKLYKEIIMIHILIQLFNYSMKKRKIYVSLIEKFTFWLKES